ncbi:MAG: hypothetical protein Q4G10_08120, partial [Bacteroidia bacterium]|nr:hypothetical protein [Bacteroidia bacterium]
ACHGRIRSYRIFRKQFRGRSSPYVPLKPKAAGGSWRTFVRLGAFALAQVTYLMIVYSIVKVLERCFAPLPLTAEFLGVCKPTFSKKFFITFPNNKKSAHHTCFQTQ